MNPDNKIYDEIVDLRTYDSIINPLCEKIKKDSQTLTDFFGIVVKRCSDDTEVVKRYNIYVDGKLAMANIHTWDIELYFKKIIGSYLELLYKAADKEEHPKNAQKLQEALEKKAQECEKELEERDLLYCHVCHSPLKKGSTDEHGLHYFSCPYDDESHLPVVRIDGVFSN